VNYQKVIDDLRAEIKQRDAVQTRDMQQVRGDVAALNYYQRAVERETWELAKNATKAGE